MAQIYKYSVVSLPKPGTRIFKTKSHTTEVTAVGGTKITRVIEPPLDYFLIEGPEVIDGIVEVPYVQALKSVRAEGSPVLTLKGGKHGA